MLFLLGVSAVMVVFTGPLADRVGRLIGVSGAAVTAWDIAKWPVLILIVSFMISLLYYTTPNVKQPGFRWVTPGGLLAVLGWIVASALFGLYVGNFGSYNKTYGTLGGVIAFLVWLWISNVVILLGAELNAELERQRLVREGQPADKEPYLPLRDEPK
jgi:membrane protein